MITEDYVSFEIAKLLKEKGFDEEVRTFYSYDSEIKRCEFEEDDRWDTPNSWDYGEYYLSAPTHQMAMKWLRKKYNIIILVAPQRDKYCFTPWQLLDSEWVHTKAMLPLYDTYEDACEAAIKYCLENLI